MFKDAGRRSGSDSDKDRKRGGKHSSTKLEKHAIDSTTSKKSQNFKVKEEPITKDKSGKNRVWETLCNAATTIKNVFVSAVSSSRTKINSNSSTKSKKSERQR